jgi:hypothetical protein
MPKWSKCRCVYVVFVIANVLFSDVFLANCRLLSPSFWIVAAAVAWRRGRWLAVVIG